MLVDFIDKSQAIVFIVVDEPKMLVIANLIEIKMIVERPSQPGRYSVFAKLPTNTFCLTVSSWFTP
jgi:hypothetical protein